MAPLGTDIRIVPLTRAHLPSLASVVTDPQVLRFTRVPDPPPEDFLEGWFTGYEDGVARGRETRSRPSMVTDRSWGTAVAPTIDPKTSTVGLGYMIVPAARGGGIATRPRAAHRLGVRVVACGTDRALHQRRQRRIEAGRGTQWLSLRGDASSLYFKQELRADTEMWSKLPTDP
jgi:hypothetical protein